MSTQAEHSDSDSNISSSWEIVNESEKENEEIQSEEKCKTVENMDMEHTDEELVATKDEDEGPTEHDENIVITNVENIDFWTDSDGISVIAESDSNPSTDTDAIQESTNIEQILPYPETRVSNVSDGRNFYNHTNLMITVGIILCSFLIALYLDDNPEEDLEYMFDLNSDEFKIKNSDYKSASNDKNYASNIKSTHIKNKEHINGKHPKYNSENVDIKKLEKVYDKSHYIEIDKNRRGKKERVDTGCNNIQVVNENRKEYIGIKEDRKYRKYDVDNSKSKNFKKDKKDSKEKKISNEYKNNKVKEKSISKKDKKKGESNENNKDYKKKHKIIEGKMENKINIGKHENQKVIDRNNYLSKKDRYLLKKERELKQLEMKLQAKIRDQIKKNTKERNTYFKLGKSYIKPNITITDWFNKWHNGRAKIRRDEHTSDWIFDRAQMRSRKRDKAHWYFNWMSNREDVRFKKHFKSF